VHGDDDFEACCEVTKIHQQTTAESFPLGSLHMYLWLALLALFMLDIQADNLFTPMVPRRTVKQ
jgi:hypothetical protein